MKYVFCVLHIAFLFLISCHNRNLITHSGENGKLKRIAGVNLWVARLGNGEPLFLIPGGPGSAHVYLHNFDSLSESNLLVFVDYYGRGQSDTAKGSNSYSFERDVEDIERVRKALGFGKINILGHSLGSVVAQKYAIKYELNVAHLIIANGFYSAEMYQKGLDSVNNILEKSDALPWDLLMYYDTANSRKEYKDPNYPNVWNNSVYYQMLGAKADVKVENSFDVTTHLKNLKIPILFLVGKYDRICLPELSMKYKEYCPQATFEMLYESGHYPQVEEPGKVVAIIKNFLRK